MKRAMKLEGELCGNCAGKIQDKICKIDGVNDARVNFMTMRFTLDADENRWDDIMAKSKKVFDDIEPSCKIVGR
ncbi:MAG: cation transporter [Eggerthellaceae bacterium]|nr:cation transporter [Eggerthellaceae bacterium]